LISALFLFACGGKDIEKGWVSLGPGLSMAIRFFQARRGNRTPGINDARLGLGQALIQKAFAEGDSASFAYGLVQLEACRSLAPSEDLSEILTMPTMSGHGRSCMAGHGIGPRLFIQGHRSGSLEYQSAEFGRIVYGKLGEPEKAEALFRKALQLDSADASANFNLGMIYWQAGDVRQAMNIGSNP